MKQQQAMLLIQSASPLFPFRTGFRIEFQPIHCFCLRLKWHCCIPEGLQVEMGGHHFRSNGLLFK